MFKRMSIPQRVNTAKQKITRVMDHLLYLLELHENNAIILYSPVLSRSSIVVSSSRRPRRVNIAKLRHR
jgi:hypothetical protein